MKSFKKKLCPTLGFSPVPWVRLHDIQTRNNNLWITQRVVLCLTRDTLHGGQLPSHRANCAVKI
ncbi:hypothetical protein SFRURICE_015110 [Spodoptera frugiperda]|nr:hypothetical protein SFRURICE_015110 [Spodoptera frugiperda]